MMRLRRRRPTQSRLRHPPSELPFPMAAADEGLDRCLRELTSEGLIPAVREIGDGPTGCSIHFAAGTPTDALEQAARLIGERSGLTAYEFGGIVVVVRTIALPTGRAKRHPEGWQPTFRVAVDTCRECGDGIYLGCSFCAEYGVAGNWRVEQRRPDRSWSRLGSFADRQIARAYAARIRSRRETVGRVRVRLGSERA